MIRFCDKSCLNVPGVHHPCGQPVRNLPWELCCIVISIKFMCIPQFRCYNAERLFDYGLSNAPLAQNTVRFCIVNALAGQPNHLIAPNAQLFHAAGATRTFMRTSRNTQPTKKTHTQRHTISPKTYKHCNPKSRNEWHRADCAKTQINCSK